MNFHNFQLDFLHFVIQLVRFILAFLQEVVPLPIFHKVNELILNYLYYLNQVIINVLYQKNIIYLHKLLQVVDQNPV